MKIGRALVASFLLLGSLVFAGRGPVPFDVVLEFEFAEASGDVGFREEVELQLITELRGSACFRSVEMGREPTGESAPEDLLRLRITVLEVFEETTHEVSTAQRTDPRSGPGMELAHTSMFRAYAQATLEHPASNRELRTKKIGSHAAHRPLSQYDDARHIARREALIEMVREIRVFVCKGGSKRLGKELTR